MKFIFIFLFFGSVFMSLNAQLWVPQSINTTQNLNDVFFLNKDFGWIVGDSGTIFQYSNGNWHPVQNNITANINAGYMVDTNNIWVVCDNGAIYKYDSGSISQYNNPTGQGLNDIYMLNDTNGWAVGELGTILKFENDQWTDQSIASVDYSELWQIDFYNDTIGYIAGLHSTLLKYDSVWIDLYPGSGTVEYSAVHMTDSDQYFLGSFQAFPGSNWSKIQHFPSGNSFYYNNQSAGTIKSIEIVNGSGWAVSQKGEILKYNSTSFDLFQTCSERLYALELINDSSAWIVGDEGTLLKYVLTSHVEEDSLENINQPFKMYPNPFSDQLAIQIFDSNVSIQIFDIKGNLIESFNDLKPSEHKINMNLDYLKRGVYIIKVKTNTLNQTSRFVKM